MIVVTTPTGTIGQQVLENLLDSGEPIRVIVRDPARLPSQSRGRIEVIQGSHGEIDVVNKAFEGADAVFWLVPPDFRANNVMAAYLDFTRPACDALRSQRSNAWSEFQPWVAGGLRTPGWCRRRWRWTT